MTDNKWVNEELSGANFNDQRLSNRLLAIANALSQKSEHSIPAAMTTWGDAIATYRFFDNEKVTPDRILEPHVANTINRVKANKIVLCVQDTSEIN